MSAARETAASPLDSVKLGEILRKLLSESSVSSPRKVIGKEVGITPSAMSQYIHGQSRPSMDTLVRLAAYFEVSLDYLVFGRAPTHQPSDVDFGPLARYIDLSLARTTDQAARHSALVTRVGRALAEKLDETAAKILQEGAAAGGLLSDEDTLALEAYSVETWIVSMNLQYDIIAIAIEGQPESEASGRFLPVVATNLAAGKGYKFLLPKRVRNWRPIVGSFRKLLRQHASREQIDSRCEFRVSDAPVYTGCGLYQLDTAALHRENPVLFAGLEGSIGADGWIGYVIPASAELQADVVMDELHLKLARGSFRALWDGATPV